MVKSKRHIILVTCLLSGAAAILSFASLGTQSWVTSDVKSTTDVGTSPDQNSIRFGLFGGLFKQTTIYMITYELTMVCDFQFNVCALLCGDDMKGNLKKLYKRQRVPQEVLNTCPSISDQNAEEPNHGVLASNSNDRIFINAGVYVCTLLFLILSAVIGLISSLLALWNTAANPQKRIFNILGLYMCNAIAFFSILLAIVLWGAMFANDLIRNLPFYETFIFNFTTKNYARLGYSYWLNFASLALYLLNMCLLYTRNYLIANEARDNTHIDVAKERMLLPPI